MAFSFAPQLAFLAGPLGGYFSRTPIMIRDCLLEWRNKLIAEGHYTDAIDEVLPLFMA